MKKVSIFTTVLLAALLCLAMMPIANAQDAYPPFVQNCLDSCEGQPIAWGEVNYKGFEGTDIWFAYQNSDGYVIILVNGIVPSDVRQNLQGIQSDAKKTGWKTEANRDKKQTTIGTANYNYLCGEDVCTNKKVVLKILDKTKKTGLALSVKEYFD